MYSLENWLGSIDFILPLEERDGDIGNKSYNETNSQTVVMIFGIFERLKLT